MPYCASSCGGPAVFQPFLRFYYPTDYSPQFREMMSVSTLLEILQAVRREEFARHATLTFQPFLRFYRLLRPPRLRRNTVQFQPFLRFYEANNAWNELLRICKVSTLLEILPCGSCCGFGGISERVSTLLEILHGYMPPLQKRRHKTVSTLLEILQHMDSKCKYCGGKVFQPFLRFYPERN